MRSSVAVLALVLTLPASAAILTSALAGRATSGGQPAPCVTVTATSRALLHPRTTTTSARGTYWLDALPPGEYDVTFTREGLTTLTRRAVVELGRVARADAVLEPGAEGDAVTSTAKTISVADTTEITTHFDDAMLDRMPSGRDPLRAARLGPLFRGRLFATNVDDVRFDTPHLLGEEAVDQVTVVRGAAGAEFGQSAVVAATTRSGGEDFSLVLRDTLANDFNIFESASGGRIVRERLWFFASGWSGDRDGYVLKLDAQPAAAHRLVAEAIDAGESLRVLRYTGILNGRATLQAVVERDRVTARAVLRAREHLLSGGADGDAWFLSDRWSARHWILKAGVRRESGDVLPRIAIAFDPRGDGSRALTATYGEFFALRMTTVGYAAAIGASGSARVDFVHREQPHASTNEGHLDVRYRLFDRFEAGAALSRIGSELAGAGWINAEFPVGSHEVGATLLQRRVPGAWPLDLALRYAIPYARFRVTLAADLTNAFGAGSPGVDPRALRFWVRMHL